MRFLNRNTDREWERFGIHDPYYGVISLDKFRREMLDSKSLDEFFTSGEDHINFVFRTIRGHINSEFSPSRSLDFGCGVGRCSIPVAQVCPSVVGVDVSNAMLEEARKNCIEHSISNIELLQSDDSLIGISEPFDFIHSFLVFQHIPTKRGERILAQLVRLLSYEGVAALQFLIYRKTNILVSVMGYLRKKVPIFHNLVNLLYKKPFSDPLMEKNVYSVGRLLSILTENGVGNVHIVLHGEDGLQSAILFFQKGSIHVPYDSYYSG
jgi:SAM-dependent methyltransferase